MAEPQITDDFFADAAAEAAYQSEHWGAEQTSAGKRRPELIQAGLVADSGVRRPSPSGASAIVWQAV